MPMKAPLTGTALEQLAQLTTLRPKTFRRLLLEDLAVDIGTGPDTGYRHRLAYSTFDRKCVVAIQGRRDVVVRVVDVERHNREYWPVPVEAQWEARRLACPSEAAHWEPVVPREPGPAAVPAQVFRVTAYCLEGGKSRSVPLGSWPLGQGGADPHRVLEGGEFLQNMLDRAAAKGVDPATVGSIYVRVGNLGREAVMVWSRDPGGKVSA